MKKFASLLLCLLCCQLTPVQAEAQDRTATEVINDMAPGWNLGNTLEGVATWSGAGFLNNQGGLAAETAWQSTKTTQEVIDYVKSLGFRSVRIPCYWAFGHIRDASTC